MEPSEPSPPPHEWATAPSASVGKDAGGDAIVRVPVERQLEAIQSLLRSDKGAAERFVRFAIEHKIRLDALWGRLDDRGRIAFAALASSSAGRTATLFASPAKSGGEIAPIAQLVQVVLDSIRGLGVDLAQALVDPSETRQIEVFHHGGMNRLAELSYLERPTPTGPARTPVVWPADLTIERWNHQAVGSGSPAGTPIGSASARAELIETLERSYVGTLDCPSLAGLRRGEDILEGHLHSGTYEPTLWSLLRFRDGRAAGVCLFNSTTNAAAGSGSLELVYFGLVPEARGRGLGRLLLQHGLDGLRGRRESTVMLAVDDRNEPAHRIYREAGFRVRFRRIAFIRGLRRGQ